MYKYITLIIIFLFGISFFSCGKKNEVVTDKKDEKTVPLKKANELSNKGKEIFYTESKETGLKCADCHSDGANDKNPLTRYYSSIKGANKRTSTYYGQFKGDDVLRNAGGASICWKKYLLNDKPLSEEQINSLNDFYSSVSIGDEPPEIKYQTIALPKGDKVKLKEDQTKIAQLSGEPSNGERLFNEACTFCHSDKSNIKKVPNLFKNFEGDLKSISFHIRLGVKYMPFFAYEKINDKDIADITAFILEKNKK